jgi:hypothetical protein
MSILYEAPPTLAEFMRSTAFGRAALGPVGSGKTTACAIELLRRAIEQAPAPDGYRYTRFAIVRQTLKQLKDTILKDCQQWMQGVGEWKVSENTFHVRFEDVVSEWPFIPLENSDDQARLLSMQLTGAWLSECIEMDFSVVAPITGRIGRYPSGARGAPTWNGIIADTNMPTEMTPWHVFFENLPNDWEKFVQPSGLAWNAENLNWLLQTDETLKLPLNHPDRIARGRLYYTRLCEMNADSPDWVKRYVMAQYGNDPSGEAVFRATFNPTFHCVDETLLVPGYPLIIGQDFGRNPWSLICQCDHMGRLIVHQEVPAKNIGLEKHVNEVLRPLILNSNYQNFKICVVGDPSGVAKSSISEESCFDCLKRLGLPVVPAPTNDIDPRIRSVESLLGRAIGGQAGLVISRKGCPWLIRAMSGGYRYTKTKLGGLRAVPEKNDKEGFSHVCDDLQYVALCVLGNMQGQIAQAVWPRARRQPSNVSSSAWT